MRAPTRPGVRDLPARIRPQGLRPPQQMRFVFRQERRRQAAWQFPTAQDQAACSRDVSRRRGARDELGETVELRVLGKSPAWQDAGGACSGYLVATARRCLLLDCGMRRVRQAAQRARLRGRRRRGDLAPARRPHPGPRAVRVRAHVRAAPPAGAGRRLARHRRPAAAAADRAARRARHVPAPVRGVGMREEHIENAFRLEEYDPGDTVAVGDVELRFQPVPHFLPTHAVAASPTATRGSPTAPTRRPATTCARSRATPICC